MRLDTWTFLRLVLWTQPRPVRTEFALFNEERQSSACTAVSISLIVVSVSQSRDERQQPKAPGQCDHWERSGYLSGVCHAQTANIGLG